VTDDFTGQFWEDHYREPDHDSHQAMPNPHLFALAERLRPGKALDAGCGEGGDAIRLAQLGWRVTGVDISATAIHEASRAAAALGLENTLVFRCLDLTAADPGSAYDLVTAHHVHTTDDGAFIRALAAAVRPGGLLLVVGHEPLEEHEVDLHSPGSHITAQQVASYLDPGAWSIEVAEPRLSVGTSPDGDPFQYKDSVFQACKKTTD